MWSIDFIQILLAFALDFVLGDPRWIPNLKKLALFLANRLGGLIGGRTGKDHPRGGPVVWAAVCGVLIALYIVLYKVLMAVPILQPVAWLLQVFLLYQCFKAMELHRQVWAVIKPMSVGDDASARQALVTVEDFQGQPAMDVSVIPQAEAISVVGRKAATELVAPLFWASVAGIPGALLYRGTHTLGALAREGSEPAPDSFAARADFVLTWIPARLVAVMSETFREFRSFRQISRDARRHPRPNEGWGEAAVAYAVGVRLDGDPNPAGEGLSLPPINETGLIPTTLHVSQALFWFWRVTVFTVILAAIRAI